MKNTGWLKFNCFNDKYGHLVPIEEDDSVPFDIKRVYYIYGVDKGVRRGFHSHVALEQALICVHGSVKILVKTPYEEENILLNDPTMALYIGPMVWREMYDFSSDAVLLVLASEHYDVKDYLRDYKDYEKRAREYFLTE
ncbi:MAG: FdtA/QdtA family cupin domain-containing protein [Clostridiales bacterium]|nr:FdtA/QdtA family cupin domain-containing protein [Clostridiales bacterium]